MRDDRLLRQILAGGESEQVEVVASPEEIPIEQAP